MKILNRVNEGEAEYPETSKHTNKSTDMPTLSWFANTDPNNPNNPLSYVASPTQPSCDGNRKVCAIFAQLDSNNKPIITPALDTEISTAIANRTNSTNVTLRN